VKKTLLFAAALSALFAAASCGSDPAKADPHIGGYGIVYYSVMAAANPHAGILVGIGTSRSANLSVARSVATLSALGQISVQLQSIVSVIIREYLETSGSDPSPAILFNEAIVRVISQTTIRGATVVREFMDDDGNYWVVVALDRGNSIKEIESAAAVASAQVLAFNADIFDMDRMNRVFDTVGQAPPGGGVGFD